MSNAITLKKLDSGIMLVTIDLPGSKMNLLSESVLIELNDAIDQIESDTSVRGVIIASGKEDNFGAGANVEEIQALQSQPSAFTKQSRKVGRSSLVSRSSIPSLLSTGSPWAASRSWVLPASTASLRATTRPRSVCPRSCWASSLVGAAPCACLASSVWPTPFLSSPPASRFRQEGLEARHGR